MSNTSEIQNNPRFARLENGAASAEQQLWLETIASPFELQQLTYE